MAGSLERWKVVSIVETVLVVDGDDTTRNALKLVLELNGYRVVEALHGIEALQILGEWGEDIQLAVCADELPDMTAGQWRGQVRFLGPEIPTLVLSERDREDIADMPVGPCYGGLPAKAPMPARLLERIRAVLDERFFAMRARASAA
jgi:CheY-like chemotaxis protein